MEAVRTGPMIGLAGQVALLAGVAGTVGLGRVGWLAALGYGLATFAWLTRALRRAGASTLGPADRVTLTRAALAGGVTALTADSFVRAVPVGALVGLATAALILDFVDGRVARLTATASRLGASFDMEVDASLILVLSVYVAVPVGAWVLAIGLMRYAFGLAGRLQPWLRGPVPHRYWRKVVAAVQGIALVTVAAGVLPAGLAAAGLGAALALLLESFGRDVVWLWRHRAVERVRS